MDEQRLGKDVEATRRLNELIDIDVNGPLDWFEARDHDIMRSARFEPIFDPSHKKEKKDGADA